jgi:hypothetical protein
MDYQGALKFLGLSESASSDDMVRAKNKMRSRYQDQEEELKTVSANSKQTQEIRHPNERLPKQTHSPTKATVS